MSEGSEPESSQIPTIITVAVIDDQAMVRTGLISLLGRDPGLKVVGEASDGRSGLALLRRTKPDVVLMDIRMPVLDGIAATAEITTDPELNATHVVILTTFDEDEQVLAAIRAGAAGFLLKDIEPEDLRRSIRVVATGAGLLAPTVTATVLAEVARSRSPQVRPDLVSELTERERQVLIEIGRGRTNDEIAAELIISPATARTYVSRLLGRLRVRDRSQLVVLAYEAGLITPGASSTPAGGR